MCADSAPAPSSVRTQELDAVGALLRACLARLDAMQLHLEGAYVDLALRSLAARLLPPDHPPGPGDRTALH
jgi:hypothetical protein